MTEARAGDSALIDRELVERALAMAEPLLEASTREARINGSGVLHVVVMDPARTPLNASFEEAILHEHTYGKPRAQWDADYAGFARAKARLTWLYGQDSHRLQTLQPHLMRPGDTTLWGSVWLDGIVVAASGAEAEFDEAFSGTVAMLLRALAKEAVRRRPREPYYR